MRAIATWVGIALIAVSCARSASTTAPAVAAKARHATPMLYVGGETGGIWLFSLDETTGALNEVDRIDNGGNASFFALTPDKKRLYSTVENLGKLSAYGVNPTTGKLTLLNQVGSTGTFPTHVSLVGPWLLAAHYQAPSGLVAVFGTDASGKIASPPVDSQTPGQWSHQIVREKTTGEVFVPCKGADRIVVYGIDETTGKLTRHAEVASAAGAGPRHIDFHPSGKYAYVMNENDVAMAPYKLDAAAGLVPNGAPQRALPAGIAVTGHTGAEAIVSPSGTFVYGSARGAQTPGGPEDTLAIFPIDAAGKLGTPAFQPTGGNVPRSFTIDPEEKFLIVANLVSKNVVVFRMSKSTGALTKLHSRAIDQNAWFVTLVRFPR